MWQVSGLPLRPAAYSWWALQVTLPKRSQSSQDMVHLQHRPARAPPSLASTPEKAPEPWEGPDSGQQQSSQGEGRAPTGPPQKGGGLGWGVVTRVASGLLGSGTKKGSNEKKVGVSGVVFDIVPVGCGSIHNESGVMYRLLSILFTTVCMIVQLARQSQYLAGQT